MKLAALGLVTAGIGIALSVPGLAWIGVLWVALGWRVRRHGKQVEERSASGATVDRRAFAVGTLLFLAIGVPSLVVGIGGFGFDAEHDAWRWLPIVVGALTVGIAVLGGVLYLVGGAALAVSDTSKATVPATLGSLRVGDGFRALVEGPDDPTAMEILWDEPVSRRADPPAAPRP